MTSTRIAIPLILAICASACSTYRSPAYQTGVREPISLRDDDDGCGASLVQSFVGLRANATVREDVTRRSGAALVRWIEPGMAVTQDFRADRINAILDEDGVVSELRCG